MTTTSPAPPAAKKPAKAKYNPYPWYSPRFWQGMKPGAWWKLCAAHGFRIHPLRWPMAAMTGLVTPVNSIFGTLQRWGYGRAINLTKIDDPPVFILGHWRSGTTLLHELMNRDGQFFAPTTYQCFAPHHFLVTEKYATTLLKFLLPKQRPTDNMAAGWNHPQEDEFALLTLGAPTPYLRMAFPNDPPPYCEFFDMVGCDPADLRRFEETLVGFARVLTFASKKRLLLKSPPHTGRVELLSRLFPGARFIHITRSPYALFPSTLRLWHSLDEVQGLQFPKGVGMEEYVFDCLARMYRGFEDQRQRIDPSQICDLRYEDLVADPVGEVGKLYERLNLGEYGKVRDKIADFAGQQKDYKTNQHDLDDALKARIRERWAGYFERYGYE